MLNSYNYSVLGLILANVVLVFTQGVNLRESDIEPTSSDTEEMEASTVVDNPTDSPKVFCTWVSVNGSNKNKMLLCTTSMDQLPSADSIQVTINTPEKPTTPKLTFKQMKTAVACGLINDVAGESGGRFWKKMLKCDEIMKNQRP